MAIKKNNTAHFNTAVMELGLYNKDVLDNFKRKYASDFINKNVRLLYDEGMDHEWIDLFYKKKALNKAELCHICALPFGSKILFEQFKGTLHPDVAALIDELVWGEDLHEDEIRKKLGFDIVAPRPAKEGYAARLLRPEFEILLLVPLMNTYRAYSATVYRMTMNPTFRRMLGPYYKQPEGATINPLSVPPHTAYAMEGIDTQLLGEVQRFKPYAAQDNIKSTVKSKVSTPSANKAQRVLKVAEFFPDTDIKELKNLRTLFLSSVMQRITTSSMAKDELRVLMELFHDSYHKLNPAMHVLGFMKGSGYLDTYDYSHGHKEMLRIIKSMPKGKWVSAENLLGYIRYNFIDIEPVTPYAAGDRLYYEQDLEEGRYYANKVYISSANYKSGVVQPFIKGMLFYYAAFGILDIRYDAPADTTELGTTYYSPYDNIAAFRLTPMGEYLLGLSTTYTPPTNIVRTKLTFAEDALVITADQEDESVAVMLAPFANRIGPSRYHTDFKTFLRDCRTEMDVSSKISLFSLTVGQELPPNWKAFFAEIRAKVNPFTHVEDTYSVFKLPPDNKALIQLIAKDEVLKASTLKAEDFHVLVHKNKLSAFKKRLQEFGYILS